MMPTPLETLSRLRSLYPTPMSSDQLGTLLNQTAWVHRHENYGLCAKPTGANCPQPFTGKRVSKDLLMLPDGSIFDCLIDSDGAAIPTWGTGKKPVNPSRFVSPMDPLTPPPLEPSEPEPPEPPANPVMPYNESYAIQFGHGCNAVYAESGAPVDPGMISVHSQRAAWDYYVGGMSWDVSYKKHLNEFRSVYGLRPV